MNNRPNVPGLQDLLSQLESRQRNDPHDTLVQLAVRLRAGDTCEYCLLRTSGVFHVDHIIPPDFWQDYVVGNLPELPPIDGRRGPDHLDNFAWCCPYCNGNKSQRVTAKVNGRNHRLFDPRHDVWPEHFVFMHHYLLVIGITPVGQATQQALNVNHGGLTGPLGTRHDAILRDHYPPPWARAWIL